MTDSTLPDHSINLAAYASYATLLAFKMFFMVFLTAKQRFSKKVFASPEDLTAPHVPRGSKISFNDPDVERMRRAHLNDLENIPIYLIISYLYVLTSPQPWLTVNLFRAFFAVRVSHSIAYAILAVHPMRMISYFIGLFITLYMAVQVLLHFWVL